MVSISFRFARFPAGLFLFSISPSFQKSIAQDATIGTTPAPAVR